MTLNNGLPQGSVLAPLLYDLYPFDMPETISRKFGYADHNAQGAQHKEPKYIENILTTDLASMVTMPKARQDGSWLLPSE